MIVVGGTYEERVTVPAHEVVAGSGLRAAAALGSQALDRLVSMQEGGIRVQVPAIDETSVKLVRRSGLGEDVLAWTVSCHRASYPCGACPGCWKRRQVLSELGMLNGRQP